MNEGRTENKRRTVAVKNLKVSAKWKQFWQDDTHGTDFTLSTENRKARLKMRQIPYCGEEHVGN